METTIVAGSVTPSDAIANPPQVSGFDSAILAAVRNQQQEILALKTQLGSATYFTPQKDVVIPGFTFPKSF